MTRILLADKSLMRNVRSVIGFDFYLPCMNFAVKVKSIRMRTTAELG